MSKRKKRGIWQLVLVTTIAVAAMGGAYAAWTVSFEMEAEVTTYDIGMKAISKDNSMTVLSTGNDPESHLIEDNDGSLYCELEHGIGQGDKNIKLINTGTVPLEVVKAVLTYEKKTSAATEQSKVQEALAPINIENTSQDTVVPASSATALPNPEEVTFKTSKYIIGPQEYLKDTNYQGMHLSDLTTVFRTQIADLEGQRRQVKDNGNAVENQEEKEAAKTEIAAIGKEISELELIIQGISERYEHDKVNIKIYFELASE